MCGTCNIGGGDHDHHDHDVHDDDWEEWDGKTPFWHHCVAGSIAGLAEHALVYPLDTIRTHIQVYYASTATTATPLTTATITSSSSSCCGGSTAATTRLLSTSVAVAAPPPSLWQTIRHLTFGGASFFRLWRGIQTVWIGCIPAHALYFGSYEAVKAATRDADGRVTTYGSILSGAVAMFFHDVIMSPLDTVKQRLQLGHYRGSMMHAIDSMMKREQGALYRSFPVTLATNVPYGMVMVSVNEFCKQQQQQNDDKLSLRTMLVSSSIAGFCASAVTTPLDRIKTSLQTQQLTIMASSSEPTTLVAPRMFETWKQAANHIYKTEGSAGFVRGIWPRIFAHTPAVAISWTTYEMAKQYLASF